MGNAAVRRDAAMGTNFDRPTRSDQTSDDGETPGAESGAEADEAPRRDVEAACRSFEADERAATERERTARGGRTHEDQDWNAVGLVTSLGATCLFGVGGLLARSTQLTTVAWLTVVAAGVLLARRWRG